MSIPGQTFQVNDPGLGAVPEAVNSPIFFGVCSGGVVNQLYSFTQTQDAASQLLEGPLSEAVCQTLGTPGAGGPVYAVPVNASVAGSVGSMSRTAGTGSATVACAGTPNDGYEVQVLLTKAGALGAAEFTYSLDDGYTQSDPLVVPTGGTYVMPKTGLTLTFTGTFVVGDRFEADCVAPFYSANDIANAMAAVLATGIEFAYPVLTGEAPTTVAGVAIAAAMASQCGTLFNSFRFVRAMMAAGRSVQATAITDYASFASTRMLVTYGRCDVRTRKPIPGWGFPNRPIVDVVAARAAASLISTDLGRLKDGPIDGVMAISHDEALNPLMDAKNFTTMRTWQGRRGFFITHGRLMSNPGSDYKYWQHGRCVDVACDTAAKMQQLIINTSTRTNSDGTIDERDAGQYESPVRDALRANLIEPDSAEGTPGHVRSVTYDIDRNNNVLGTDTLQTTVGVMPRGYVKHIVTQIGMTANAGG